MIYTILEVSEGKTEKGSEFVQWKAVDASARERTLKLYSQAKIGEDSVDFEDRMDEFRQAKNKTYDVERATIDIGGGKKWMPVIKAVEVKDVMKQAAVQELTKESQDNRQVSIEGQVAFKVLTDVFTTWFKVPLSFKEMEKAMPDDNWRHLFQQWTIGLTKIDDWLYGGEDNARQLIPSPKPAEEKTDQVAVQPVEQPGETGGAEIKTRMESANNLLKKYKDKGFTLIKFEKWLTDQLEQPFKASQLPTLPVRTLEKLSQMLDNISP